MKPLLSDVEAGQELLSTTFPVLEVAARGATVSWVCRLVRDQVLQG